MDPVLYWNSISLEASRRDFTRGFANAQQPGPIRTSRALAIIHLAIHDAVAFGAQQDDRAYLSKKQIAHTVPALPAGALTPDIIAGAAVGTLKALYPRYEAYIDDATGAVGQPGFDHGLKIAQNIISHRDADGWNAMLMAPQPENPADPDHRADPYQPNQMNLGPKWGAVTRFLGAAHKPLSNYPGHGVSNRMANPHYRQDFEEVRDFGGVSRNKRTAEQQRIGVYWGYDGAMNLGVPPRLYNQIARKLAGAGLSTAQLADLFARVNVAMADAGIDAWFYKYKLSLWRPVVGVRNERDPAADPFWAPLGAPQTNTGGRATLTPNFPAYPSGHATFGSALFQVLRLALAPGAGPMTVKDVLAIDAAVTNKTPLPKIAKETFKFVSDELDGAATDPDGSVRTKIEKTFGSFAEAVWENAVSRVYLGVHWRFDGLPRKATDNIGGVPLGLAIGQEASTFFTSAPGAISNLP